MNEFGVSLSLFEGINEKLTKDEEPELKIHDLTNPVRWYSTVQRGGVIKSPLVR